MSIVGKYDLVDADKDNFDAYLKSIGVNIAMRKIAESLKPRIEIAETNGEYSIKTISTFKNHELKFKLGEEFDEETMDGRKCKSKVVQDGNKLLHEQKVGEQTLKITREFSDKGMKLILEGPGGISCNRFYDRSK